MEGDVVLRNISSAAVCLLIVFFTLGDLAHAAAPSDEATKKPPLGLDGYCPVTLGQSSTWAKGDPKWSALHCGRTYWFKSEDERKKFVASPQRWAPRLRGCDAVRFAEEGAWVPGKRQHGLFYAKVVYLFADEKSLEQFSLAPEQYARVARMADVKDLETQQILDDAQSETDDETPGP